MAGELIATDLTNVRTPLGESLAGAIDALGGDGANVGRARLGAGDIAAYVELHIEQGPVLERANVPLGVVTAIAARCSCFVTLEGQADHAGATLMPDRRDALAGAAEVVLALEQITSDPELVEETVGTVGWMRLFPNMVNIIPGHVEFRAEVRSTNVLMLETAKSRLQAVVEEAATRRGLQSTLQWEDMEQPVAIPDRVQGVLAQVCQTLGLPFTYLPSRATHDAARLASIAPVGMLFIPCKDGKSHVPEEWAQLDHIVQGVHALSYALVLLDQSM
jgi:N-carbamoyl-L-amino-acid hydrolase